MNIRQLTLPLGSKFTVIYDQLFRGFSAAQFSPADTEDAFYAHLFSLEVDRHYLLQKFSELPTSAYLGSSKPLFNKLYTQCLRYITSAPKQDTSRSHCLVTLQVLLKCLFSKNPSGWEVMEIMAGGVGRSDAFFMELVILIEKGLVDVEMPAPVRHQILEVALIFVCGIGQLSPGAYFLRRDLFPSISSFIKSPDTEQYTFEASLLLALLANYHKSDAAKLNPYLQRIREVHDADLMSQICWGSNFALEAAIKAYQDIVDDSPPTLTSTLTSLVASLRPDRAWTSKPVDPPRKFESQPIEATAVLLLLFEFIRANTTFNAVFVDYLSPTPQASTKPIHGCPPLTVLTLSSYLLSHASSSASPRAIAYAHLSLSILLAFSENDGTLRVLTQPVKQPLRLCRQRQPPLPMANAPTPPVCALLDCLVLWLRHNLRIHLETPSYLIAVRACHRVVWFLQNERCRIEYHWSELWRALCGLLEFLVAKQNSLGTTGGVEQLARETIDCIYMCLHVADRFLPSAHQINEFIYELVRSSTTFHKHVALLEALALPQSPSFQRHRSDPLSKPVDKLNHIIATLDYYEARIQSASARSAKAAFGVVASEVGRDGVHGVTEVSMDEPSKHLEDVLAFARYACADGMSLMP